ncbi:MAG: GNAT family N-acetyltransferase [Phycisphaerales bacterium]
MNKPETIPTLTTARLRLRPFSLDDVDEVTAYCQDWEYVRSTAAVPWPYAKSDAISWIQSHPQSYADDVDWTFALERRNDNTLVGAVSLRPALQHRRGEIGYGIYRPFWNNGYATEAAGALVELGFDMLGLERIESHYFACNPASGRVMEKLGMVREGVMRRHVRRLDQTHDTIHYALLRSEYTPPAERT